jgi:hypothetical protein
MAAPQLTRYKWSCMEVLLAAEVLLLMISTFLI